MSRVFERATALSRIDAVEVALKRLLAALESKSAPAQGIESALSTLESLSFDPRSTIEAFESAPSDQMDFVKRRLERLAALDSIVRAECERMLATTTLALERTRILRASLDHLADPGPAGEIVDDLR